MKTEPQKPFAQDLSTFIAYYNLNKPSEEILKRFKESIRNNNIHYPLYCEENDTISGIIGLNFTIAIAHDVSEDPHGTFAERYCFENQERALIELAQWHERQFDDQRPSGWVAVRKVSMSAIKTSFEKHHGKEYGLDVLGLCPKDSHSGAHYHSAILSSISEISQELGYTIDEVKHIAAYLKLVGLVY